MSKRDAKRDADDEKEEEEESEEEDISESGEEEEESDEEMSESEDGREEKKTSTAGNGKLSSDKAIKPGSERSLHNQPFDEAVDLSESEDNASEAAVDSPKKTVKSVKNMPFDEALELSASAQDLESPVRKPRGGDGSAETGKTPNKLESGRGGDVKNKPFDEAEELSDSGESVDTNGPSSPKKSGKPQPTVAQPAAKPKETAPVPAKKEEKPAPKMEERKPPTQSQATTKPTPAKQPEKKAPEPKRKEESESEESESESEEDEDEDEEDDEEEDEENTKGKARGGTGSSGGANSAANSAAHATMLANAGAYKESDYAHLKVSNEIKELFQYIGRFKPQEIELETRMKCFIPEYIPAVGDMDAFLKIPRPDGEADHLGLKMLDEPSLTQSDATVLDLQLRATSKKKHGDIVVRSIENAEKSTKEIDKWIKSIADLHRTKPPPQVHYTKPMPDIESLMQVWPEEFEELLGKTALPSASMDISVEQYIRVICAVLDIPVYKNVYESLHVLFTLYLEFRSNQHFMNYDEQLEQQGGATRPPAQSPPPYTSRREREELFQDDSYSSRK